MEWLEEHKIPVGKGVAYVVTWLTDNAAWFFDGLAAVLEGMIGAILWVLQSPPALIVVAAFVCLLPILVTAVFGHMIVWSLPLMGEQPQLYTPVSLGAFLSA